MTEAEARASGPNRRRFLGVALGAAGVAAAGGAGFGVARATEPGAPAASGQVPFYGAHQAGIATPAQDRLAFAAFDVTTTTRDALRPARLLGRGRARMTAGEAIGADGDRTRRRRRSTPARPSASARPGSRSRSASGRRCSTTGSASPASARPRSPTSRHCPATRWTRTAAAATCASRPARTTRRSRSTPSATSPGSGAARR